MSEKNLLDDPSVREYFLKKADENGGREELEDLFAKRDSYTAEIKRLDAWDVWLGRLQSFCLWAAIVSLVLWGVLGLVQVHH
ncbi:MAG: hypothetical protein AAF661_15190 [Pseudomonadota bacterium]